MSGLLEVDCSGCGRRYETSAEQARKQRVLRCACGQFVRLDRALAELRSDPAPPQPVTELANEEEDEDEQTQMLGSLAAVAAMSGRLGSRAPQPSMVDDERASRPVPRGTLRSLSPAPVRSPSSPPGASDKPLWYVDLGGSEMVEMTIEQLIIARRSGKLGEGALVWREGMPRWRPVGTLIPAGSRPTPTPPAPSQPPAPRTPSRPTPPPAPNRPPAASLSNEALPQSLASYERPLATLEFALEKPALSGAAEPVRSPLPSNPRSPSRPPRALTPVPRPATWSSSVAAPAPTAPLAPESSPAPVAASAPVPLPLPLPLPPPPVLRASPVPAPLNAERPTLPPSEGWLGDRPRWVSACIALLVCVTASGSGAYLVRSLKQRQQPAAATSSAAPPALTSIRALDAHLKASDPSTNQPMVVDLESLSVERHAPRAVARPASPASAKPATPPATEPNSDGADPGSSDAPVPAQTAPSKPRNSDLPSAARANPYTTGSDNSAAKKTPAAGSGEPGF